MATNKQQENAFDLNQIQEELIKKLAELTTENEALKNSVEKLSELNTELKLHNKNLTEDYEKLHIICKEQQEELESYQKPCKDGCIKEPDYLKSDEEKLNKLYHQLHDEELFFKERINNFKHRIIDGERADYFKALLKKAEKNLKRINRLKKQVLK